MQKVGVHWSHQFPTPNDVPSLPITYSSLDVWLLSSQKLSGSYVYRIPHGYFLSVIHCSTPLTLKLSISPCENFHIPTSKHFIIICLSRVCWWRTPGHVSLSSNQSYTPWSQQKPAGVGVLWAMAPSGCAMVHILFIAF